MSRLGSDIDHEIAEEIASLSRQANAAIGEYENGDRLAGILQIGSLLYPKGSRLDEPNELERIIAKIKYYE